MTEATPDDAAAQRAAEQARIRKAKREAKIRAGGASRLNKITGLGGGFQRDDPAPTPPSTTSSPAPSATSGLPKPNASSEHADPEEIDISQHYYEPASTPRPSATGPPLDPNAMTEDQLRQMMLGFDRPGPGGTGGAPPINPFAGSGGEDDPLMKMLSQMMAGGGGPGGMPGFPGAGGAQGGFPAGFPGMPGMPGMQTPEQAKASSSEYLWRILHAVFAISLGLYIALTTTFSGTKVERERTALAYNYPVSSDDAVTDVHSMEKGREVFFWIFATTEAILLTTRFFIERGRAPAGGMLWTIVGFLPGNIKTYAATVLRYGQIFATVRNDILVCVFVLGIASWIRG